PFGYHLTNVFLHGCAAIAMCFLSVRILAAANPAAQGSSGLHLAAAVAALLFALHPLRVESVAWATERRDVLSGVFFIATLIWSLRYVAASPPASRRAYGVCVLLYLFCLLAKASGAMLPIALMVLDVYPLRRLAGGGVRRCAALVLEKAPF